jgi:hypothetical protein
MMKNYRLLWGASAMIVAGAVIAPLAFDRSQSYVPRKEKAQEEKAMKGAAEWLFNIRKNPATGTVDYADVLGAQEQMKYYDMLAMRSRGASSAPTLTWQELGPDNVGGRTRALLIDKNNPDRMYAGGVGGGLWISGDAGASWSKYNDTLENIAVTSICQSADGHIYFGTGEGLYALSGSGAQGFIGGGIWKSTDATGTSFTRLSATIPTSINNPSIDWVAVNKLAAHPTDPNIIFAATQRGVRISTDAGQTWLNPVTSSLSTTTLVTQQATDVDVSPDGSYIIAAIGGKCYKSATGAFQTWDNISDGGNTSLPTGGVGRAEFAISPDDPNYIYASLAKSAPARLYNIYLSQDAGATWTIIGPGGSLTFEPFGSYGQGDYDNAIEVFPGNKYSAVLGGVELWKWVANSPSTPTVGQWTRIALEQPDIPQNPFYVHADKHAFAFRPGSPSTFYVGCDGGVFKTIDGGMTFIQSNRNYNVTQFYTVAFKANGWAASGNSGNMVMGGTQDNGTQYINSLGNTEMSAIEIDGGDGGYCEFASLNPNALFTTVYHGTLRRSPNDGAGLAEFYNNRINGLNPGSGFNVAGFITPIALWESTKDLGSPDSVTYVVPSAVSAGTTFNVASFISPNQISYTTPVALNADDTIKVQDYFQSKLAVGFTNQVFMTREALNFATVPKWTKIAGANSQPNAFSGMVQTMAWANDGDILYVGTVDGRVYRLSNIRAVIDSTKGHDTDLGTGNNPNDPVVCTQIAGFSSRCITSIAVDPNNADRVVVTLGNYGQTQYIWYSTTASTCATSTGTANFANKTGTNLPTMPIYGSSFDGWNPNRVVLGTELGIYATDNITAGTVSWDHLNAGTNMPNVPVFMVRQQQLPTWRANNSGTFYAATHGRGIWKTTNTAAPVGIEDPSNGSNSTIDATVVVTPNPVSETALVAFTLKKSGDVTLKIYDLRGKLVKTVKRAAQAGVVQIGIDSQGMNAGTYLVSIEAGAQTGTTKFVVVK